MRATLPPPLEGKRALVAGASRGIVAAIVRRIAADSADPAAIDSAAWRPSTSWAGSTSSSTTHPLVPAAPSRISTRVLASSTSAASNAERVQTSGLAVYAMTKGAIASLTKGLARELGPRAITVNNAFSPDPWTQMPIPQWVRMPMRCEPWWRWAGMGTPAMWPQSSAFWPVANPATSPARTGTSTAASCSDSPSASRAHQIRSQMAVESGVRVPTGIGHDQHE